MSTVVARAIGSAVIGYLAGLLPSAEMVAGDVDPRRRGSGNPGAANVGALKGRKAGAVVAVLDVGKAAGAGLTGRRLAGSLGANVAASAAVIGHCYPATRGFDGGKGMAASFGQMLVTFPAYLPVDLALGVVAANSERWKDRPLATAAGLCLLWTGLGAGAVKRGWPNLWGPEPRADLPLAAAVSSVAIVARFWTERDRVGGEPGGEEPAGE